MQHGRAWLIGWDQATYRAAVHCASNGISYRDGTPISRIRGVETRPSTLDGRAIESMGRALVPVRVQSNLG
jgi:hypothetical protein